MSKLEKKEGAKITCGSCGHTLICKMSEYTTQQNKLQWQNEDGGAHYKWIRDKEWECKDKNGVRIPPKPKNKVQDLEQPQKCVHGIILGQHCPNCASPKPSDDRLQTLLNKFTVLEKDLHQQLHDLKKIKEMVDANLSITSDAKVMLNDMVKLP